MAVQSQVAICWPETAVASGAPHVMSHHQKWFGRGIIPRMLRIWQDGSNLVIYCLYAVYFTLL